MFSAGRPNPKPGKGILVLMDGVSSLGESDFSGLTALKNENEKKKKKKNENETLAMGCISCFNCQLVSHLWYIFFMVNVLGICTFAPPPHIFSSPGRLILTNCIIWISFLCGFLLSSVKEKILPEGHKVGRERVWSIFLPCPLSFSTCVCLSAEQYLLGKTSSTALAPTGLQKHYSWPLSNTGLNFAGHSCVDYFQ